MNVPDEFIPVCILSENEHRILALMGSGLTTSEICNVPGRKISYKTVQTVIARICAKLGWQSTSTYKLSAYAGRYTMWLNLSGMHRQEKCHREKQIEHARFEFKQ